MKILKYLFNAFFTSPTPNLFGSQKRRKEKAELAGTHKKWADETTSEIERMKAQNPFETAAAKSAMAESKRRAKQTQQKFANIMGGQVNPEAMVAAQQATQEAVAGTAGDIAVGAEANKAAEIARLRGIREGQRASGTGLQMASIEERGQGWKDFFSAMESVGKLAEGVGGAVGAF